MISPPVTTPVAFHASIPDAYIVKAGDNLTSISIKFYGSPSQIGCIYHDNKFIKDANIIYPDERLNLPGKTSHNCPALPVLTAVSVTPAQQKGASVPATTITSGTQQQEPGYAPRQRTPATSNSSFESCVIARESGGNAQVMNSSSHYGLFQFSASTWAEYGGNPAEFGNASAAEQQQVFSNAMAAGGQSNWSPYDGC